MSDLLKARLTKSRAAMGWSQQQLAEVSGVAAAQISRYESGRSAPRPEVIDKLAKALNVSFDWLARGVGPIERGEPEERTPSGTESVPLELSDEEHESVAAFAKLHGITLEMAVRRLFLEGVRSLLFEGPKGEAAISDLQLSLLENKALVQDLKAMIERFERGSNS